MSLILFSEFRSWSNIHGGSDIQSGVVYKLGGNVHHKKWHWSWNRGRFCCVQCAGRTSLLWSFCRSSRLREKRLLPYGDQLTCEPNSDFSFQVIALDWWPLSRDCLMYAISVISLICVLQDNHVMWYEALMLVFAYFFYISGESPLFKTPVNVIVESFSIPQHIWIEF